MSFLARREKTSGNGAMKLGSSKRFVLVICVLHLLFVSQVWAYGLFTVGGDGACGYHSLQDAIDAATDPEGNTVFVTRSMDYTGQAVTISNRNLAILGGLDDCSAQVYSGQTTVRGGDGNS